MSNSYSKTIEYKAECYEPDPFSPVEATYKGRFWFHHTSDTVTWERTGPDNDVFESRMVMSNQEYDALERAAFDCYKESESYQREQERGADLEEELKKYKAGVVAALEAMENNYRRGKDTLREMIDADQELSKLDPSRTKPGVVVRKYIDLVFLSANMLHKVRYAFKNAGLPVATVTGPPVLLVEPDTSPGRTDQPSLPQPQSPSQPGLLPESQTRHLTDPGIAD